MIASDVAGRELMRLRVTQGFDKLGKDEIQQRVAALAKHAANAEHARNIVTAILENSPWFPTVADIVRLAVFGAPEQHEAWKRAGHCCGGRGFSFANGHRCPACEREQLPDPPEDMEVQK